ncbi:MAG: ferrous iron transport protein A [Planctomycetaceae bacterium]|nr:ferrous iron transport protein A [Planctomycetaceae bacterium]
MSAPARKTLDQCELGETCIVQDVTGTDSISIRLMEMGVLPGESIQYIGLAPLGDPLEYRLANSSLSLRRAEAQRVVVD